MADVVKGKWYPSPPPALPGEPDEAYTARLTSIEHGPYDHVRKRGCAIGYHRSCSARGNAASANYQGSCGCPCHSDDATMVGDEGLREVVEILCDVYSLPTRTGWHVVHFVDVLIGTLELTVERVRLALGREYDSEISEGFADDVVHMLANKGPAGEARAFWKRVHADHRKGKALLSMVVPESEHPPVEPAAPLSLRDAVNRAIETATRPERPRRVESLGWEHLGPGPHPEDQPRIAEWLGKKLSDAMDEAMPSLLGVPVEVDPSMPPGTWKMRMHDGSERTGMWPRITVPGVETLAEALKRLPPQDPPPKPLYTEGEITEFLKYQDLERFIFSMTWFRSGLDLIERLRMASPSLPPMAWLLPPDALPPGSPEMTQLYNVPVRYVDNIRPHLAFELKEITP